MTMNNIKCSVSGHTRWVLYCPATDECEELVIGDGCLYNPDCFGVINVRDERLRGERECDWEDYLIDNWWDVVGKICKSNMDKIDAGYL